MCWRRLVCAHYHSPSAIALPPMCMLAVPNLDLGLRVHGGPLRDEHLDEVTAAFGCGEVKSGATSPLPGGTHGRCEGEGAVRWSICPTRQGRAATRAISLCHQSTKRRFRSAAHYVFVRGETLTGTPALMSPLSVRSMSMTAPHVPCSASETRDGGADDETTRAQEDIGSSASRAGFLRNAMDIRL